MSHEIYYTSAPEGLKRGTSGFCTVAASEGISKPLWDRLETLSAYRHHFGTGSHENPVSHAHWMLNISGKTHHVLSRICDSGVDHTQRSNAFAHHLVLETAELEAAAGGPAWMLQQPGVMAEGWDGTSGALPPNRLARGDSGASRICRAWEAATGDAGWGGHLADLFAKSPGRPVCILFSPGQEMLPLMAEAIALLPPAARWNVTFNTYFTSMPTSATCLWRCCLAGTPAAQVGLRYAANGLILDLTDRTRLPALPPGPFVEVARTGQSAEAPRPAPTPKPTATGRGISPAKRPEPLDTPPRGASIKDHLLSEFDDLIDAESNSPADTSADVIGDAGAVRPGELSYDLREEPAAPARREGRLPARVMRRADEALEEARQVEALAAGRRRRQVVLLFACALGAIAVGSVLIVLATRSSGPSDLPGENAARPKPAATVPVAIAPVTTNIQPQTTVATPITPQPKPVDTAPIAPPVEVAAAPAITYPPILTLAAAIERPNLGTGIGDRVQSLALRAADLDKAPVSAVRLSFFDGQTSRLNPTPASATSTSYNADSLGTLTAQSELRTGKLGVALRWKDKGESGVGAECLFIAFDKTRPGIDLQWRSGVLLKNPGLFNFVYWTLQGSSVVLERAAGAAGGAPQTIVVQRFSPPPINYAAPDTALAWPVDLPREMKVAEPPGDSLPSGWHAEWYPDWEGKEPGQRTAENASQVIRLKKPTGVAVVDSWFLITFRPGLTKVESTFTKRMEADQRDLARFESDLRAINSQIEDVKSRAGENWAASTGGTELKNKHDQTTMLIDAYKAALSGYNELVKFDIALEMPDGMRLLTLHFQRPDAPHSAPPTTETGK